MRIFIDRIKSKGLDNFIGFLRALLRLEEGV